MKPGEEIRLVKDNLAFAVGLWKAASAGRIPLGSLLQPANSPPQFNQQAGNPRIPEKELTAELTRGAANQMRGSFALSALQSQRSMADAFPGDPIEEEWPELRAARCSLYLIGLAVRRSVLQPVWECPPPYRRLFHIRRFGFTLNATGLDGRILSWDDFGGLDRYLSLLGYCANSADAAVTRGDASRTLPRHSQPASTGFGGIIGAPAEMIQDAADPVPVKPPRGYPGDSQQRRLVPGAPPSTPPLQQTATANGSDDWDNAIQKQSEERHPQNGVGSPSSASLSPVASGPSGSIIQRFIAERCVTGEERRTLAGELYAGFLRWCGDTGHETVSQRAFGMRLTAMGLTRKRRGHGKHWWEGIRLADAWQV